MAANPKNWKETKLHSIVRPFHPFTKSRAEYKNIRTMAPTAYMYMKEGGKISVKDLGDIAALEHIL